MVHTFDILRVIKTDSKGTHRVLFESCYRWIGFAKENIYWEIKNQSKKDLLWLESKLRKKANNTEKYSK